MRDEKIEEVLEDVASLEMWERGLAMSFLYAGALAAVFLATPVLRRGGDTSVVFLALGIVIVIARLWLELGWQDVSLEKRDQWNRLYVGVLTTAAAYWGIFAGWIVVTFELGWTSFFTLLVTSAVCAGTLASRAPHYKLLVANLSLLLAPTALGNLLIVGGLRGVALAGFVVFFWAYLLMQGRVQNRNILKRIETGNRLRTMVNAVPGTLAWVSSDQKYLGVNHTLADIWQKQPREFVGKEIGFMDPKSPLVEFCQNIFTDSDAKKTAELERNFSGDKRRYVMIGQRFNNGSEALVLGFDVSPEG